ncbi:MAG: hypothetical protein M1819_000364 [Sarea resinae]|nr:MAG: hypothetical protein M1819_000364 [Sarea resinae]
MESINNAASAASKAIWGDNTQSQSGQEPVSGQTGAGTTNEPYDAGNTESNPKLSGLTGADARPDFNTTRDSSHLGNREGGSYGGSTSEGPYSSTTSTKTGGVDPTTTSTSTGGPNISGPPRPEHETDKTGVTGIHSNDPKFEDKRPTDADGPSTSERGQSKAPIGGVGAVEPSVGSDPASGTKPTQKQQGADRPNEEPTGENLDALKERKETADEKVTGSGDSAGQPLGEGKSSGGDAEDGPGAPSKGEGTGEKYVKSTGLAADGGDFDVANPGAGREADRLLEEKGIHHTVEPPKGGDDEAAHPKESGKPAKDKPSVGDKIKGKLHLGKKE